MTIVQSFFLHQIIVIILDILIVPFKEKTSQKVQHDFNLKCSVHSAISQPIQTPKWRLSGWLGSHNGATAPGGKDLMLVKLINLRLHTLGTGCFVKKVAQVKGKELPE